MSVNQSFVAHNEPTVRLRNLIQGSINQAVYVAQDRQDNPRKAMITRFAGERTWHVVGWHDDNSNSMTLTDGPKTELPRADAIELAIKFVAKGWMTL